MAEKQLGASLPRLVEVMERLLAPDGCPWDREQTFESLRPYVIEEAHEVVDAIERGGPDALREELGDLLLQVVFLAALARSQGWFDVDDVVAGICDKMVRRHPHVFGDVRAETSDQVVENWERIKAKEKAGRGALEGVPVALPGLLRAVRVGEKAARVGYDWPEAAGARVKVDEELSELDAAAASGDRAEQEKELGDVLFALASWARKQKLDPEAALRGSLNRFTQRFGRIEQEAAAEGLELSTLSEAELDARWARAKAALRSEDDTQR